eukprot:SAG11_NODE_29895_length_306_cov_0.739130_1_plen_89_part_01
MVAARHDSANAPQVKMLWDTGAENTLLSRDAFRKSKNPRYRAAPRPTRIQGISEVTDVDALMHGGYQQVRVTAAQVMPGESFDLLVADA